MRFVLASEHREFFSKNRFIEFEDLIADVATINSEFDVVLMERLKKLPQSRTPQELFKVGRDVWRKYSKLTCKRGLAEIAASLFHQKTVRLAYDQILKTTEQTGSPLMHNLSLQQASCFQPILGGVIVRISHDPSPPPMTPIKVGSGLFLHPDLPLPWTSFFQNPNQTLLLIVYAPEKTLYILNKDDPHTHELKREGYAFGDRIQNPIIFK
jgi:hypothetical protein